MNIEVSYSDENVFVKSVDLTLNESDIELIKEASKMIFGSKFDAITFLLSGDVALNCEDGMQHEVKVCKICVINPRKDDVPGNEFYLKIETESGLIETYVSNLG
jgi:hypothetical protein